MRLLPPECFSDPQLNQSPALGAVSAPGCACISCVSSPGLPAPAGTSSFLPVRTWSPDHPSGGSERGIQARPGDGSKGRRGLGGDAEWISEGRPSSRDPEHHHSAFRPQHCPPSFCRQPFHHPLRIQPSPLSPPGWGANPRFNKEPTTPLPWPAGEVQPSSATHRPSPRSRRHPRSELEARRLCAQSFRGPRGETLEIKAPGVRRSKGETAPGSASPGLPGRWVTRSPFFLLWLFTLGFSVSKGS